MSSARLVGGGTAGRASCELLCSGSSRRRVDLDSMARWPDILHDLGVDPRAPARPATEVLVDRQPDAGDSTTMSDFSDGVPTESTDGTSSGSIELFSADELIGQTIRGHRIEKVLGVGAWSVVFEAAHEHLKRRVAIKVLQNAHKDRSNSVGQRMFREARAMALINHPNVVRVLDCGNTDSGLPFLVLELVSGRSLANVLMHDAPLSEARTTSILEQLCQGLRATHGAGLVHRDLKPSNIMIDSSVQPERVKILDFGLTLMDDVTRLTRPGDLLGTPAFMAPEQITAPSNVDAASDMYSVGMMLYLMLTGRPPYTARNPSEMLEHHLRSAAPLLPGELGALAFQLVAKAPSARPTAEAVVAELQAQFPPAAEPRWSPFDTTEADLLPPEPDVTEGRQRRTQTELLPRVVAGHRGTRYPHLWTVLSLLTLCVVGVVVGMSIGQRPPIASRLAGPEAPRSPAPRLASANEAEASEVRTPVAEDPDAPVVEELGSPVDVEPNSAPAVPPVPRLEKAPEATPLRSPRSSGTPSARPNRSDNRRALDHQLRQALEARGLELGDLRSIGMPEWGAWQRARSQADSANLQTTHEALVAAVGGFRLSYEYLDRRLNTALESLRNLSLHLGGVGPLERDYLKLRSELSDARRDTPGSQRLLRALLPRVRDLERRIAEAGAEG